MVFLAEAKKVGKGLGGLPGRGECWNESFRGLDLSSTWRVRGHDLEKRVILKDAVPCAGQAFRVKFRPLDVPNYQKAVSRPGRIRTAPSTLLASARGIAFIQRQSSR